MVKLVYCVDSNALGEVKEILFQTLKDAIEWIENHVNTVLKESAGYSVYNVVPDGELPETLYNYQK